MPALEGRPNTSFTFVTGSSNTRASDLASLNSTSVHGLAGVLRNQASTHQTGGLDVNELRVGLEVDRPLDLAKEAPRAVPLSVEIGDIVTGLVTASLRPDSLEFGQMHQLMSPEDKSALQSQFPFTPETEIPILWK